MSARGTWREDSHQRPHSLIHDHRRPNVGDNHSGDCCCFANLSYLMLLHRARRAHILQIDISRYLHYPPTLRVLRKVSTT
jgi:hypothetical protein